MRTLLVLIVLLGVGAGAAWFIAGRSDGPAIEIVQPSVIGQTGQLVVNVKTPGGSLSRLDIALEQNDQRVQLFALTGQHLAQLTREGEDQLRVSGAIGKRHLPALISGAARIVVEATRPVLFGYQEAHSSASRDIEVRLNPPMVAVQSMHHYINLGGSEMVVYRASPQGVTSGVRVGEFEYPGYPASGAGVANAGPDLFVAFFALLWNQDADTPIAVFARDDLGNEATAGFDYRIFPKVFRNSRIDVDDRFLARIVPRILQNSPDLQVENPSDLLASYLRINRDLRRQNNALIANLAKQSAPQILWQGPFKQLMNTAVEAGFADQRTYVHKGQDVDKQVHLGFDLASTAAAPVLASNHGRVVYASWLGIYGNCVIVDHGMGLQTLYAHLSAINVAVGDEVKLNQQLGRSGATGLAGGDHLHFTTLIAGQPVTPVDWWSSKWVEDRILRKLREAGAAIPGG